jgi:hypothetical protein
MFIPDPIFFHPESRIDPGLTRSRIPDLGPHQGLFKPVFQIRIGFIADPDLDPAFDDQNWKNFTAERKICIFLMKNCNLLIPRPP